MTAIQEQINEAREIFKKAENTPDPNAKRLLVERATDIFEECMESEPSDKEIEQMCNVKKAFARALVEQFPKMNFKSEDTLMFFIFTILIKLGKEATQLSEIDSVFKAKLKWIWEQYSVEVAQLLKIK